MCTALTYKAKDFYFGRTLDNNFSYGEEVIFTPRNFPFSFRSGFALDKHYSVLGTAIVRDGYPLYFDAFNEKGLCAAGLNFVGNAEYSAVKEGMVNLAQFEFIPYILGKCASLREVAEELTRINITNEPFSAELPPAELHWLIADRSGAFTLECTEGEIKIYPNSVGVLTNNPPFPEQMFNLNNYMNLSPYEPKNNFCKNLSLKPYSRGMGALGLPGDFSSQSRFVRAAFVRNNSVSREGEEENVGQFFHLLDSVSQPLGCCAAENGYEYTVYSSCCNAQKGIYYFTTYSDRTIKAVDINSEDGEGTSLVRYPFSFPEKIFYLRHA